MVHVGALPFQCYIATCRKYGASRQQMKLHFANEHRDSQVKYITDDQLLECMELELAHVQPVKVTAVPLIVVHITSLLLPQMIEQEDDMTNQVVKTTLQPKEDEHMTMDTEQATETQNEVVVIPGTINNHLAIVFPPFYPISSVDTVDLAYNSQFDNRSFEVQHQFDINKEKTKKKIGKANKKKQKRCAKYSIPMTKYICSDEMSCRADSNDLLKKFGCDYCIKKFKTKAEKRSHERRHTDEKPYACEICGEAFRYNGSLKNHISKILCSNAMNAISCINE